MSEQQEGFESNSVPPDSTGIVLASPVPPGGDLIHRIERFMDEHMKPSTVGIVDPLTGTNALVEISKDGVSAIPANVFDDYLLAPRSREGTATVTNLDSFIDHTNRFKGPDSIIFADDNRTSPKLTSVLDYHPQGAPGLAEPAFGRHRAVYAFPLSDEWKAWSKQNKNQMNMVQFAEFLEDRIIDVLAPGDTVIEGDQLKMVDVLGGQDRLASPSRLIELSRGLQVYENAVINESHKLSSGEGEISFQAEHSDGQGKPLVVPTCFLIAIPVFHKGAAYQVLARLRYRAKPNLVFWYELWRTDRVFDHAFGEAAGEAELKTQLGVLYGAPEMDGAD
jgi:uncharacterized protein YfdQ (DUF2303 family)